ncbi:MAG: hypothetical protein H6702_19010 [Myxococcales bacterium]|nr:hypothetical protein [Myxococcales bacterium]
MPIVRLEDRSGGAWRGQLAPDDFNKWFTNYETRLTALAQQAKAGGATWLVVGSELNSLQARPEWPGLFQRLRPLGLRLAWSANWDAFEAFPHWGHVDLLGVTGYFPLGADPAAAWAEALPRMRALRLKHGKPLLLTEVGWPARATARERPWDDGGPAEADPTLQARLWQAFCDAAAPAHTLDGFFAWNWFGVGGPRDSGYSLRGKPGAATLSQCFARPWQAP